MLAKVLLCILVAVAAASALFRVLFVVVSASAFAFATTFILASAAMTAASAAVHVVEQSLYLVVCSFAVLDNVALEVELVASERVVEVNLNLVSANFQNLCYEEVAVLVFERNLCALEYVLAVEVSVNGEHLLVELDNTLWVVFAERLVLVEFEVKLLAASQILQYVLEGIKGRTESSNEHERLFLSCFLYEVAFAVLVNGEKLIVCSNKFVCLFLHF